MSRSCARDGDVAASAARRRARILRARSPK